MANNLETALYQAAAMTFEQLAFMFPSEELEGDQLIAKASAIASVTFRGEFDGRLTVVACGPLLPTLAVNMLGEDEPHSEQMQHDALGEIANIICGNVLPLITNPKAVFDLDAPETKAIDEPFFNSPESPAARVQIGLEEGRVDLLLFLK